MKKTTLFISALCCCYSLIGKEVVVKQYNHAGPYPINAPFTIDSLDVNGKKYSDKELLKSVVPFSNLRIGGKVLDSDGVLSLPASELGHSVSLVSFYLNSDRYTKGTLAIQMEGIEAYEVYLNGKQQTLSDAKAQLTLEPQRYEVVVKYLSDRPGTLKASFDATNEAEVTVGINPEKRYSLGDVFDGTRISSVSLSPNGKFLLTSYHTTLPGGKTNSYQQVTDRASGRVLAESNTAHYQWQPQSNRLYYTRSGMEGKELVLLNPADHTEVVVARNLPEGWFTFAPTEDFLLFTTAEEGPKEGNDLQQILVPDDRQPGWRNRSFIHKYDLKTGVLQRLTYGHTSTAVNSISPDGRYLLFTCSEADLTKRPFATTVLYRMDLQTMQTDILLSDPFISYASFSPDGTQLVIAASGEAFDGIGLNIAEGQKSNLADIQLFSYQLHDKKVTPLTQNFNPNVQSFTWYQGDKQIYLQAEDKDCVRLYVLNPTNGVIKQLPTKEEIISSFTMAQTAPELVYFGQSASNSHRMYAVNLKKNTSVCLKDLSQEILKDVTLGEVHDWNFQAAAGDTIYGRFYLPPHFDPNKKYPLIVNYYGGTSPTERTLENRYPSHVYAALGYIVYIIQPSGATGFGQEFAARHVNAWGERTGDEIIEGTKKFCKSHPYVDSKKIGCMGASYGGFMTQYLQTKTDLFAAAISHAGISDVTSYWGEGYWGYSYSALASADSYPWNARDMYTLQSPLFNADKIKTPILFLHGTVDTNVPIGESIQMFTALKLLGRPTAFVQVVGENHQIMDYNKREKWNKTIYAWFAKWLKGEGEWWNDLYPEKNL